MAALEAAGGEAGREDARIFGASAQCPLAIRGDLSRALLRANAASQLYAGVVGTGARSSGQGTDQSSAPGANPPKSLGPPACGSLRAALLLSSFHTDIALRHLAGSAALS